MMGVLLVILAIALLVTVVRLCIGPTLADQVVALDLIAIIGVAMMTIGAIAFELTPLLDVAMLLALIGFIGTIAFASYIEGRGRS